MAEADILRTFACNQCGTVEDQRTGRGRRFTRCTSCRTAEPTGANALRIANAACNQRHTCEGCGAVFKPKRAGRARFCTRECAFAAQKRSARGPKPYQPKPPVPAKCRSCGGPFMASPPTTRFCGDDCRDRAAKVSSLASSMKKDRRDRSPRACGECGAVFVPEYGNKRRRFCSEPCQTRNLTRRAKGVREARKRALPSESVDPIRVFDRDGWICLACGIDTPREARGTYRDDAPELDHRIPLSRGGHHAYANTQCLCRRCNQDKGDSLPLAA